MNVLGILASREYMTRLRSKGFIIGTALGIIGIMALSFISAIGSWFIGSFKTSLAIVAPDEVTAHNLQQALGQDYRVTIEPYRSTGPDIRPALRSSVVNHHYDAALIAYRDTTGSLAFAFYPRGSASLEDQESLKRQLLQSVVAADFKGEGLARAQQVIDFPFVITNLNPRFRSAAEAGMAQALVYFLLLLLYVAVIMYGVYVGQGVIEEKSNRVMEIMIGIVRPAQLLAGKITGIGALALTQMLTFAVVAAAILVLVGLHYATSPQALGAAMSAIKSQPASLTVTTVPFSTIIYLLIFFILGFFTYATMFAGVASLTSKAEDIQQSNGILVGPIVLAYLLSIFALQDPDKPLFVWASLVPLVSPMLMFTRVATSTVPPWQIATSIGLSLLAIWGFTLLAAKLYRVGVLMYGKPMSPKEIWRALRAPT